MSAATPTDALVGRILEGQAPFNLRSAAARGAVPLPRTDLVRLYVILLQDREEQVRRDAAASLAALSQEAVRDVLSDPSCAPEVLAHLARQAVRDESMAELIAFHDRIPDQALEMFAALGNAQVIDLVLTNEERLLSQPGLLDKLTINPALRADQRGRILELLDRASKLVDSPTAKPAADSEAVAVEGPAEAEEAARLLDVDVGELFASSEILDGEEFEQAEDPLIRSVYKKIVTLNTAQKAILAMKGGREERMILIRDTNKVVALGVLRNPRVTENDVQQIALMRSVSDEVLRKVGTNRDWIKSYTVVTALVSNPKTPPGVATNFIPRLMNKDLKNLTRDRNVPEIIRRMAKRVFDTRTQKRFQPGKKR